MSELFDDVLEGTVSEADQEARQRLEAEADMANVLQWITRIQRADTNVADAITLSSAWMNA